MTLDRIRIVSIRAIARKNNLNLKTVWKKFQWYALIYGDNPEYVIREPDGRKRPTERFVEFLEEVLGRKIVF